MKTFDLPDLGEGLQEAEIVTWHVAEGEKVVTEQPLVSVETDKAVVEIPAPYAGTISHLHADAGATVKVGAPLVDFDGGAARADTGTVVGRLPEATGAAGDTGPATPTEVARPAGAQVRATPAVRALARKLGVDLAAVQGTGPGGAPSTTDIEAATGTNASGTAETSTTTAAGPSASTGTPLKGVRRAMARAMAASHAEVVPVTVHDEADITDWAPGADFTIRLLRAIAAGCAASPELNAWYDSAAEAVTLKDHVDIGVGADTEDGLFVPVMRDIGSKDDAALRAELEAFKEQVNARALPPEDMKDPTITLTNFGVFGAGLAATPIILPPQVAIVGAGRVNIRPAPETQSLDADISLRRFMPVSITFDHRVVTGGEAARFLAAMMKNLSAA